MAVRSLVLKNQIRKLKDILKDLRAAKADFEAREAELNARLDGELDADGMAQAETDVAALEREEQDTVKATAETIAASGIPVEADESLEGQEKALEGKIAELESELSESEERSKDAVKKAAEDVKKNDNETRRGEIRMNGIKIRSGFFKGMSYEERAALCKAEDVKAFAENVRSIAAAKETRGVTNASVEIPETLLGLLVDNLHRYSKLFKHVSVVALKGKGRQNIFGAIPEGVWTEATAKLNELTISFSQIELDGFKVGGFIAVPNSILEDSIDDLVSIVMDSISQAIGFALDKALLYGTGVKMPKGIVTRLACTSQPAWWGTKQATFTDLHTSNIIKFTSAEAALTDAKFFAALTEKLGVIKANYSSGEKFWAMNTATYNKIMAKAVTVTAAGAITAQINNAMPIVGGAVEILDFMADGDIVGGYGDLYKLLDRKSVTLASSEHAMFIEDQTVFKGTARYDGMPVFGEAFVAVNILGNDVTTSVAFAPDTANTPASDPEGT